jgi:hypothetical protein
VTERIKAHMIEGLDAPDGSTEPVRPLGPFTKKGVVITTGASGAWDAGMVEAACPVFVPEKQMYGLFYTGYAGTTASPTTPQIGVAWSMQPEGPYTKDPANPILSPSGVTGDPDRYGVTGFNAIRHDDGSWTVYSIGLDGTGYEGGTPRLCRYTTPSLSSPSFTRHGASIVPAGSSWRASKVWIGSVVEDNGVWHMFLNGTAGDGKERIGHGVATSPDGPWAVDTDPVLDVAASTWESNNVGQPWVFKLRETWYMEYYGYNGTSAGDGLATTSEEDFPLGWTKHPANPLLTPGPDAYDAKFAHKPFSLILPDRICHFYTAVAVDNTRQVALVVIGRPTTVSSPALTVEDENGNVSTAVTQIDFQGAGVTATAGTGEVVVTIPGAATPNLLPLTTLDIDGVPSLVWDENDELVLIEVTL